MCMIYIVVRSTGVGNSARVREKNRRLYFYILMPIFFHFRRPCDRENVFPHTRDVPSPLQVRGDENYVFWAPLMPPPMRLRDHHHIMQLACRRMSFFERPRPSIVSRRLDFGPGKLYIYRFIIIIIVVVE